jgi:hypothetical protein
MIFYKPHERIDTEYFRYKEKYTFRNVEESATVNLKAQEQSLSIVTRCMNRLYDLEKTLPKNIEDNEDYKNLEFVLLDYNSTDGLGEWVKSNMMEHIESGRLNYYRTEEPKYFCPNHSQNVTFRLAQNKIVANVDSDNFTHKNYAHRLNQCASLFNQRIIILPSNFLMKDSKRLFLKGRFALFKKDIEKLRGFDEDLDEGYGNDDVNFIFRAMLSGFKLIRYESHFTDSRLPTTDEERVSLVKNKDERVIRHRNADITWAKISRGVTSVNKDICWGKAKLLKNFKEEIEV